MIRVRKLNAALMKGFSNMPKTIGKRICTNCKKEVLILETVKDGKTVQVSECLNCETLAIQKEHEEFVAEMKAKENEIIFERYSIVPDDLQEASFNSYIPNTQSQKEALKKAVYFANKIGQLEFNSLLFKGSYGVGKSHLSKSIADVVRAQGKKVIFVDVPSLLKQIKNTFGTKENATELYKAIEKADLVIFDDLGAENIKLDSKGDSWGSSELFEILTSRTGKHNVITTNCSATELEEKYGKNGGRIVSRLMKGTKPILIEGEDMRLQHF